MSKFVFVVREITRGRSVVRAFLDHRLLEEELHGKILDLGSGRDDRYGSHIPKRVDSVYMPFDNKRGQPTDFECDRLPYEDSEFETILLLNVLEHIYNYKHLLKEVNRIKKSNGVLIGFVPFLMWYHADPHDFFRYTHETLEKILSEAGFGAISVEPLYSGPYMSAFQMIYTTIPRFLRPVCLLPFYGLDVIFRNVRPQGAKRYALGYYFKAY